MVNSRGRAASVAVAALALLGLLLATAFASSAQAAPVFEARASSPVPLTAVTTDPGTGLIYAQEDDGTAFFVYDPRTNAWKELESSPVNSGNNGGAAFLDGKIYVAYTGNEEDLAIYDIASGSWDTVKNPLEAGTGNIAAGDGVLYLVVERDFIEYDPVTEIATPLAEPPQFLSDRSECEDGFEAWGGLKVVGDEIYGHQGNGCNGFAVYDVILDEWFELPYPAEIGEEGPVLASAYDPVTNTYFTYGPYGGTTLYRYDIEDESWSTATLPFEVDDGGMAYVGLAGFEGVYMIQGENGTEFTRYGEPRPVTPPAKTDSTAPVTPVQSCVVPKLRGRSLKGAKKALRAANCKPGKVVRRYSGKVKKGKLIRTRPGTGQLRPAGSQVKVIVSAGPKGSR
jgi:hypothetical protein